jgi:thioredoxin-like negative regulator of GroEL
MISISGYDIDKIADDDGFKAFVFTSENCKACDELINFLDHIQSIISDVAYFRVESDKYLQRKYCIEFAPTTILFSDGVMVDFIIGFKPDIRRHLKHVIF